MGEGGRGKEREESGSMEEGREGEIEWAREKEVARGWGWRENKSRIFGGCKRTEQVQE